MTTTAHADPGPPTAGGPVNPIGADLLSLLRTLKLSGMKDTLPERLSLAKSRQLSHHQFLEQLLADEVSRRDPVRRRPGRPRRAPAADAAGHLDRTARPDLRPATAVRPDHPAVRRRRTQPFDPGRGRGRQEPPGHRPGPRRGPPPLRPCK